ncbi:MAG: hypothetical protein ABL893_13375, partial [Hyphomicrobium sp.]
SGGQGSAETMPQVRSYAHTLRARGYKRILAWGIGESSLRLSESQMEFVRRQHEAEAPITWVFSGLEDFDRVGSVLADVALPR